MTPEQLLDMDAEKLAALSDAELLAYFEPVLSMTRPQLELGKPASEKKSKQLDLSEVRDYKQREKRAEGKDILAKIAELQKTYGVQVQKSDLPKELAR